MNGVHRVRAARAIALLATDRSACVLALNATGTWTAPNHEGYTHRYVTAIVPTAQSETSTIAPRSG